MFLFYQKLIVYRQLKSRAKFRSRLAYCHLSKTAARIDNVITLRNALRHMTVADAQRREVLCITKGLRMLGAYTLRIDYVMKSVAMRHA
jgi:hypothetical protein